VAGTEHGFEAGSRLEPGCEGLHSDLRGMAADDGYLADVSQLKLLYGARIAGLWLTRRGDVRAAMAALFSERDAALASLASRHKDGELSRRSVTDRRTPATGSSKGKEPP
jgi:hypothetical protein